LDRFWVRVLLSPLFGSLDKHGHIFFILVCDDCILWARLGQVFSKKKNYSLGSGTHINAWIDSKAVLMLSAGDHSFLRMSKQIAPVWLEMFGCQILVSNFIFGGW
jgi:hypothetical protein